MLVYSERSDAEIHFYGTDMPCLNGCKRELENELDCNTYVFEDNHFVCMHPECPGFTSSAFFRKYCLDFMIASNENALTPGFVQKAYVATSNQQNYLQFVCMYCEEE